MRFALMLSAAAVLAQTPQSTVPKPASTMKELMVKVIYPFSDAVFYIDREPPKNEAEWIALEAKALALAEIGNLLMAPGRAYNQDQWMKDAKLLVDAGNTAYKAAVARNLQGLIDINADLYESCQSCHEHYRPGYRRR